LYKEIITIGKITNDKCEGSVIMPEARGKIETNSIPDFSARINSNLKQFSLPTIAPVY
jgi:hypothetical protein